MGKQARLFLLPDDYGDVQSAIERYGRARFLPDPLPGQAVSSIDSLFLGLEQMGKVNLTVFIAREQDLERVKTKFVPGQGYYVVDDLKSPVVEFTRCYFTGSLLRQGRIYFRTGSGPANESADNDFARWANSILKGVIKDLEKEDIGGGVYLSKRVRKWIDSKRAGWRRSGFELVAESGRKRSDQAQVRP